MKKTLVALAAVAATSAAFAEVSIYGLVDMAYTTATGANASLTHQYAPSHIGFKGSEDLGNGMKAEFNISTQAPLATSGVGAGWESFVGVSGGFGAVKIGQFFDPAFIHNATYNLNGMSAFGASNVGLLQGALTARQIQYSLPAMVTGLSVVASQSIGVAAAAANSTTYTPAVTEIGDKTDVAINYAIGDFSVGYVTSASAMDNGTETKEVGTGISYNFGVAKVAYNSTSEKAGSAATAKGSAMGISVPFGATTFAYESSSAKDAAGAKSTGTLLQVKYDLSKRTFAMLQRAIVKTTSTTNTTAVGIVHTF